MSKIDGILKVFSSTVKKLEAEAARLHDYRVKQENIAKEADMNANHASSEAARAQAISKKLKEIIA